MYDEPYNRLCYVQGLVRFSVHFFLIHLLIFPFLLEAQGKCRPVMVAASSTLFQCASSNVAVLVLRGNLQQRVEAAASFYRSDFLSPELVEYFSGRITNKIEHSAISWSIDRIHDLVSMYLRNNTPDDWVDWPVYRLSELYELDSGAIMRAISIPDINVYIKSIKSELPKNEIMSFGCTSVAKISDNEFFYGRNLDFEALGVWDHYPMMTVHLSEPEENVLSYLALGSHGVFFGGITGINEKGIFLALHENTTNQMTFSGIPTLLIGDKLLQTASTIEEAIAFLKQYRPGPVWTFVIGSLEEKTIRAVEVSKNFFHVRKIEDSSFAQTNHLSGAQLKELEIMSFSGLRNSKARYRIAMENLNAPLFDLKRLFHIMGYRYSRKKENNNDVDILRLKTIQTMLLHDSPERGRRLYFSIDPSPVSAGRFLGFSLEEIFHTARSKDFDGFHYELLSPHSMAPLFSKKNN